MKLLLVEDDETVRFTLRETLGEQGFTVVECADGTSGLHALENDRFDIVLTDVRLPGVDGKTLFRQARQAQPGAGVVLMTAWADMNDAVTVMREGARDYVVKPFEMDELLLRIARVRDEVAFRRSMEGGGGKASTDHPILGVSPPMRLVRERIDAAAASDVPVLITGEMGTGKDLCARTIHGRSRRSASPFVTVDCGVLPEPRLELALFGRDRQGDRRQAGQLENANGGTLHLEEIGELSPAIQTKLLSVIDTGASEPVGSSQRIRVNVRFIVGTSRDLGEAAASGRFRKDLFYRLNVVDVVVPALRERRQDIPLLVAHFLDQIAVRDGRTSRPALDPAATAALATWDFPGNIPELLHVLERAVALARGGVIGVQHLPPEMLRSSAARGTGGPAPDVQPLGAAVEQFEREYIQRALEKVGGHRTRAAALLGISRKSLWQRLRETREDEEPGDDG